MAIRGRDQQRQSPYPTTAAVKKIIQDDLGTIVTPGTLPPATISSGVGNDDKIISNVAGKSQWIPSEDLPGVIAASGAASEAQAAADAAQAEADAAAAAAIAAQATGDQATIDAANAAADATQALADAAQGIADAAAADAAAVAAAADAATAQAAADAAAADAVSVGNDLSDHITDTTAHPAAYITVTDTAGNYVATDVEAALEEAADAVIAHVNDAIDAHEASAIGVDDAGGYFSGSTVEAVLQEIASTPALPSGGAADEIITKIDATDGNTEWSSYPIIRSATAPTDTRAFWIDTSASADNPIMESIGNAKGDLIGFSAADTPVVIDGSSAADYSILSRLASGTGGVAWVPESGKRLSGGLSEPTSNVGSGSIASGSRSGAFQTITIDGQSSAAKVKVRQFSPIMGNGGTYGTGAWYFELWDGAIGSGTLLEQVLMSFPFISAYQPLYMEHELAAFTGSKTLNFCVQNASGATGTMTQYNSTSRHSRLEAVWQT